MAELSLAREMQVDPVEQQNGIGEGHAVVLVFATHFEVVERKESSWFVGARAMQSETLARRSAKDSLVELAEPALICRAAHILSQAGQLWSQDREGCTMVTACCSISYTHEGAGRGRHEEWTRGRWASSI